MKSLFLKGLLFVCSLFTILCPVVGMAAQDGYPNRPISLIVGYNAGGNADLGLRILSDPASKTLAQPVIVENKPGAGGYLGFTTVIGSKPDGYTIGNMDSEKFEVSVMSEPTPIGVDDVSVIGRYFSVTHAIAARADAPWNSFKELVEYARSHPGDISIGAVGNSHSLFSMLLLGKKENINWKLVPYKGLAEAIPALLGGHIKLIAGFAGVGFEQVKAGKVKLLAATGSTRLPDYPQVPTLLEMGYDVSISFDVGLVGPKGMPAQAVAKIHDAFFKATKDSRFEKWLKDSSLVPSYLNAEDYSKFLKKEYDIYVPIIKELGLAFKKK
jgi:tripartite-type tricarboxylate transporter receptor subunit TctC